MQIGPKDQANADTATSIHKWVMDGADKLIRINLSGILCADFSAAGQDNADKNDDAAGYLLAWRQFMEDDCREYGAANGLQLGEHAHHGGVGNTRGDNLVKNVPGVAVPGPIASKTR